MSARGDAVRAWVAYAVVASTILVVLLAVELRRNGGVCPPLDDAFIPLQYARGLAEGHVFQYTDGTAESVAMPGLLGPILLAPGALFGLKGMALYGWALAVGVACWATAAEQARRLVAGQLEGVSGEMAHQAGIAVIVCGPLLWGVSNGVEVPLMAMATIAFVCALLDGRPRATAAWGLVLASARPEGGVLVVILGLWQGWRQRRWPWLACAAAPGLTVPILRLALTGTWRSGGPVGQAVVDGIAGSDHAGLAHAARLFGPVGIVLLVAFAAGLQAFGRGRERSATPLADARIIVLLSCVLPFLAPSHSPVSRVSALAVGVPFALLGARRLPFGVVGFWALMLVQLALWGRQIVATSGEELTTHVAVARFVADELPPGGTVATYDIGAVGYFGGHRVLDLSGRVSPAFRPYARDGDAGAFHIIAREKPDLLILSAERYRWVEHNGMAQWLASVAVRGETLVVSRPALNAFASAATPPSLRDDEQILSELDEGDRADEALRAFLSDDRGADGSGAEVYGDDWVTGVQPGQGEPEIGIVDTLRRHDQRESFTLTGSSHAARLVSRLGPSTSPESLTIRWTTLHDGHPDTGTRDVALPVLNGWYDLDLDLGAVSGPTTFTITRKTGLAGDTAGWAAAHWWLLG